MNLIIPFENKVKFTGPVKEICSISLEHEITKNDAEVLGNFFITGTYKEHELSVNTLDFKFTIPFSVELTNRVDNDSLEFSIDNFTYDLDEDNLIVKIDYIINAEDIAEEIREEKESDPPIEELIEPVDLIEDNPKNEDIREETIEQAKVLNENEEETTNIVTNMNYTDDYITYHIHFVKETDTLESIAINYKIDKDKILEINDLSVINFGDRLLIPINNE